MTEEGFEDINWLSSRKRLEEKSLLTSDPSSFSLWFLLFESPRLTSIQLSVLFFI